MVRWLTAAWIAITGRRSCGRPKPTPYQQMLVQSYLNHRERTWAWEAQKKTA